MAFDLATAKPSSGFDLSTAKPIEADSPSLLQRAGNLAAGAVRGAGSIGATLLAPVDMVRDAMDGKGLSLAANRQRRQDMDAALQSLGADPSSTEYAVGKLGGEIAGTAGAGGAAANLLSRVPGLAAAAPNVIEAIRTAGMSAGSATGPAALGVRAAGGAITGGLSSGMVNPEDVPMGLAVGGAMPIAAKAAGVVGDAIGKGVRAAGRSVVGEVSPEVAALAQRAEQLGINVPADRIVNSKPMNALAASLNYVPFSGRAGTEEAMGQSMNRALSRTFGQDSDNVTMALRQASGDLGAKFDTVLQGNTVKLTPAFKTALADAENQATNELGPDAAAIIHKQIAQLQTKGATGEIDGQAAYNIKKALDRIGGGNSDAAFYARDLKKKLMDALNDSLGPTEAESFANVRKQYGNMLALENLAQNGAEGGVSVGRLANLKHINNPDLQELADISAQFLRTRESPHGAMQRLMIGGAAGAAGGVSALPVMAATAGAGRAANALLNSTAARNAVLGVQSQPNAVQRLLMNPEVSQFGYRAAPVLAGGR